MPDFVHDRKSVRAREKAAESADALRARVISEIMSSVEGRHWMWDLLSTCHIYSPTFTGDPLTTAFAEGERNVGLRLMTDIILTCPDAYIQAQREANERSTADERRSRPVDDGGNPGPSDTDTAADDSYSGDETRLYLDPVRPRTH